MQINYTKHLLMGHSEFFSDNIKFKEYTKINIHFTILNYIQESLKLKRFNYSRNCNNPKPPWKKQTNHKIHKTKIYRSMVDIDKYINIRF